MAMMLGVTTAVILLSLFIQQSEGFQMEHTFYDSFSDNTNATRTMHDENSSGNIFL